MTNSFLKHLCVFLANYWMVILVGAFFALTSIYNTFGVSKDVFWNTYIKSVRTIFVLVLLFMHIKNISNTISILFAFGAIASYVYLTGFRFISAYISDGNYVTYWEYMKSNNYSLLYTIIIFCIFMAIRYLNKK